ncbi:MAG: Asp-tRNA(Asn)/Glu-tRNA(Gln) amidotransferase subunit GatC [Firmicutes bacterium]|nr:Asp-tRNA(Asn)/Glu-tRNA(Gln) amidotransferase subunit GatC [Bacillota bacterium]
MIDREEVIRIAALARLDLSEEEIEKYQRDLTDFLTACAQLKKVDVSQLRATSHAVTIKPRLRQDRVGPSLKQTDVLSGGADVQDGFFRVPRIVEGQG